MQYLDPRSSASVRGRNDFSPLPPHKTAAPLRTRKNTFSNVTEKATRSGKIKVREWVKGDAHAGTFLRFLDQIDEEQKLLKAQRARVIEHQPSPDMKSPVVIEDAVLVQYDSGKDPAAR